MISNHHSSEVQKGALQNPNFFDFRAYNLVFFSNDKKRLPLK